MADTTTSNRGRVRLESTAKRVRVFVGGELVADTTAPLLVWEIPYYPTYYLPLADVRAELVPSGTTSHSPSRGDAVHFDVQTASHTVSDGAMRYPESPISELREAIRFEWTAMDGWFEEDEEVFTHPRDPYSRIDILPSSREVVVTLGDTELARSSRPHALFETGLPVRWYVPRLDVRMDLLAPSVTVTHCPYKGETVHFSARSGDDTVEDVAWSYPTPLPESERIAGLVAFYDDRVTVTVDGEVQGAG